MCFLHSYANAANERRAAEICGEIAPDVFVTTSHETLPVWREFERFNTTAVGAYVGPAVGRYLNSLERVLKESGFSGTLLMMLANGLVQNISECVRRPVFLLHSGPAAAPSGAVYLGRHLGDENLLSVDMGGTSFDVCLINKGEILTTTEHWESDQRVAIKMVDISSIGAGGGSIAKIDSLGLLRVGPESAGADPGPACYGRGDDATVTDANLVLGYVPADYFLGGEMILDAKASRRAMKPLADRLKLERGRYGGIHFPHRQCQYGHQDHRGLDQARLRCARLRDDRGRRRRTDPCRLHRRQPRNPQGGDSTGGGAVQRLRHVRHGHRPGLRTLLRQPRQQYRPRRAQPRVTRRWKRRRWRRSAAHGVEAKDVVLKRTADLRYAGQFHEVEADVANGKLTQRDIDAAVAFFGRKHEEMYTFSMAWKAVEILTLRLKATTPKAPFALPEVGTGDTDPASALKRRRTCRFGGRDVDTPVYDGEKILARNVIPGPAIIEETTTTVVIPEAYVCSVDKYKNYVLTRR